MGKGEMIVYGGSQLLLSGPLPSGVSVVSYYSYSHHFRCSKYVSDALACTHTYVRASDVSAHTHMLLMCVHTSMLDCVCVCV